MADGSDLADFARQRRSWPSGRQKRSAEWGETAAKGLWDRLYKPWVGAADGRAFLDVGCSWGYLYKYMLDHSTPERLVGIDTVAHWDGAPYDWRGETRARVELHQGDVFSVPLEDESFDYVLCAGVLMLLPPSDIARTLTRLRELLRPGGELLLRTQTFTSLQGLQLHRVFEQPYMHLLHGEEVLRARAGAGGHHQPQYSTWLTATSYLTAFMDAGFEIVDVRRFMNRHAPSVQDRILADFPASREEMTVGQLAARLVRPSTRGERVHPPQA